MILEINGQRVEVDPSFAKLSPEEQQSTVEHIAQSMSPPSTDENITAPSVEDKSAEEGVNKFIYPTVGGIAGAGAGATQKVGRLVKNITDAANPAKLAEAQLQASKNAVETWGRTQHRVPGMPTEKPGLYFNQPTYALEKEMAQKEIAKMIADPKYHSEILAQQKPAVQAFEKRIAAANPTVGQKIGGALTRSPIGVIGGGLAGIGAGMQAADAVNRYNRGDTTGAIISGLGAAGTAGAMIPHPVARVGGTVLSLGAEGLNATIDALKGSNSMQGILDKFRPKIENAVNTMVPQNVQQGIRNVTQPLLGIKQQPQGMAKGGSVNKRPKGITKAQWHAHHILNSKNKNA